MSEISPRDSLFDFRLFLDEPCVWTDDEPKMLQCVLADFIPSLCEVFKHLTVCRRYGSWGRSAPFRIPRRPGEHRSFIEVNHGDERNKQSGFESNSFSKNSFD